MTNPNMNFLTLCMKFQWSWTATLNNNRWRARQQINQEVPKHKLWVDLRPLRAYPQYLWCSSSSQSSYYGYLWRNTLPKLAEASEDYSSWISWTLGGSWNVFPCVNSLPNYKSLIYYFICRAHAPDSSKFITLPFPGFTSSFCEWYLCIFCVNDVCFCYFSE